MIDRKKLVFFLCGLTKGAKRGKHDVQEVLFEAVSSHAWRPPKKLCRWAVDMIDDHLIRHLPLSTLKQDRKRKFRREIFFGNGDSLRATRHLHDRLEIGFSILSGLQQGGHEISKRDFRMSEDVLASVVLDVATALGVEIEVLGTLPYGEEQ